MKIKSLMAAALLLVLSPAFAGPPDAEGWKLRKNMSGIKVYVRAVPGSDLKEFKAVAELNAGMASVIKLMEDTDSYPQWFPGICESKVLKMLGPRELVLYQKMNLPAPVDDRDCVLKVVFSRERATGAAMFTISSLWDYIPEIHGVIRVRMIYGSWMFVPDREKGVVMVTYRMHSEPGGSLPHWMANTAVVKRPFNVIKNMRKMLAKPVYRDARESELRLLK
jgi:hypothetical protein